VISPARIALAVATASIVGAAIVAFVWLHGYAPLSGTTYIVYGPGQRHLGSVVEPERGSGGKTVFFPRYRAGREFWASFMLTNRGRLPVKVDGAVVTDPLFSGLRVVGLRRSTIAALGVRERDTAPFRPVKLGRGEDVLVIVRYRMSCVHFSNGVDVSTDRVAFRYRYLGVFSRTEVVTTPYAVTLRCGAKLPPSSHPIRTRPAPAPALRRS
jgi:hypothetical protein